MKNEFIDVASHELRTPIQPILSLSALLRSKIQDVRQQEILDVIVRNGKRLLHLTEGILDVSKIESQQPLQLNKERFNLTEILVNAIADFRSEITKDKKAIYL